MQHRAIHQTLLLPFLALPIQEGSGKQSISILVADCLVPRPHLARILLPAICAGADFGSGLETRLQTLLQKTYNKTYVSDHPPSAKCLVQPPKFQDPAGN